MVGPDLVRIDLHTHSTRSDGTQSPTEVMAAAAQAGLDVVALTDHDTSQGWAEAASAAAGFGLQFVPGMEISCVFGQMSVHLLSYFHDPADDALHGEVSASRTSRITRAERFVASLATEVDLTWRQVQAQVAPGATVGRPHIADALVANGIVADREEAFADLLHAQGRHYVSHYAPDLIAAIGLVRAAGGVPVLAHPRARHRGSVLSDDQIQALAQAGLVGLEVDHRDHTQSERAALRELAGPLGLIMTGASDYHGDGKPNRIAENLTHPQMFAELVAAAGA